MFLEWVQTTKAKMNNINEMPEEYDLDSPNLEAIRMGIRRYHLGIAHMEGRRGKMQPLYDKAYWMATRKGAARL